jgi:hypothetical protein
MRFCGEALPEHSIHSLLHLERDHLIPDETIDPEPAITLMTLYLGNGSELGSCVPLAVLTLLAKIGILTLASSR